MENINLNEIYLIEWSEIQQCFHVDPLEHRVLKNLRSYLTGNELQFYPVALAGSRSEASEIIKELKKKRKDNSYLQITTPRIQALEKEIIESRGNISEMSREIRDTRDELAAKKQK